MSLYLHLKFDKLMWLIASCFMMLDMLVLASGWMHELVWLSRVIFCTMKIAMESNDSYFASNGFILMN